MDYEELWPGGPLFRQAAHFRLSTDSVLLADFVRPGGAARGIDLGCGSGILMLLLAQKSVRLRMTGLELLPEAAEAARDNLAQNGLSERHTVLCGDLRQHRALFRPGGFDLTVANPPYFADGRGLMPLRVDRAAARTESGCTLGELVEAAAWLCRSGGSFSLVYRPERLSELLLCLHDHGFEPKRLRLVCHRVESAPSLILIESRRDGKPGLSVEPPLILCDADGGESAETRRIYHR